MFSALKSQQKEAISILVSGKELLAVLPTGRVANWPLEKPAISGVDSHERNYGGKPSSVVVVCRLQRIVYGINILNLINGSYAHKLSFGGYRVRQISTRICVSRERFETNIIAGKPSSAVICFFKESDQMEGKGRAVK